MDIKGWRQFTRAMLAHPTCVGAIAPSSRFLARAMADGIQWDRVDTLLEYGPGTGVFTSEMLKRLRPGAKLIAIELDPVLADTLKQKFPSIHVCQGSVADAVALCQKHNITQVDAIVSGLPWAAFSSELQHACMNATFDVLAPQGQFATFAYLQGLLLPAGKRFAQLLHDRFDTVQRSPTIWANLPPATIYRCRRPSENI